MFSCTLYITITHFSSVYMVYGIWLYTLCLSVSVCCVSLLYWIKCSAGGVTRIHYVELLPDSLGRKNERELRARAHAFFPIPFVIMSFLCLFIYIIFLSVRSLLLVRSLMVSVLVYAIIFHQHTCVHFFALFDKCILYLLTHSFFIYSHMRVRFFYNKMRIWIVDGLQFTSKSDLFFISYLNGAKWVNWLTQ